MKQEAEIFEFKPHNLKKTMCFSHRFCFYLTSFSLKLFACSSQKVYTSFVYFFSKMTLARHMITLTREFKKRCELNNKQFKEKKNRRKSIVLSLKYKSK